MSTQQHVGGTAQKCVGGYAKQHRRPGTSRHFGAREHRDIGVGISVLALAHQNIRIGASLPEHHL
jgi:hypothetical protein